MKLVFLISFLLVATSLAAAMPTRQTPKLHADDPTLQLLVKQAGVAAEVGLRSTTAAAANTLTNLFEKVAADSATIAEQLPDSKTDDVAQQVFDLARERFGISPVAGAAGEQQQQKHPSGGSAAASATAAAAVPSSVVANSEQHQQQQQPNEQHREAAEQQSQNSIADFIALYLGIPECVDSLGLLLSTNLFLYWIGGAFSKFGNYWTCTQVPTHKWCMMDLKLMCVNFKNATGKGNVTLSDLIEFNKYEDLFNDNNNGRPNNLVCNGRYNSLSAGVCYNDTACSAGDNATTNFSTSLFRWSLDSRSVEMARMFLHPLCMTLETQFKFSDATSQGTAGIPRCNVNYSFFYVDPWCKSDNPVDGTGLDDSAAWGFFGLCLFLIALAALSTLVGFCRRLFKTIVVDFFDANENRASAAVTSPKLPNSSAKNKTQFGGNDSFSHPKEELQERLLLEEDGGAARGGGKNGNDGEDNDDDGDQHNSASHQLSPPSTPAEEPMNLNSDELAAIQPPAAAVALSSSNDDADQQDAASKEEASEQHYEQSSAVFRRNTTGASMAMFSSSVSVHEATTEHGGVRGKNNASSSSNDQDDDDGSLLSYVKGFFDSFDLLSAFYNLMEVPRSDVPTAFFDGIRVFAMLLVIAGHAVYYPYETAGNYNNAGDIMDFFKSYASIFILPALLAVDSFFWISGYLSFALLTKALVKALGEARQPSAEVDDAAADEEHQREVSTAALPKKQRPFRAALPLLGMAYLNRYLRLTPSMMMAIATASLLLPLWVTGPHSRIILEQDELVGCRKNMWRSALYVQNLYDPDENQCYSITWFLQVDTQIFLFIPVWASVCFMLKRHLVQLSVNAVEWILCIFAVILILIFYGIGVKDHPLTTPLGDGTKTYFRAMDRCMPYLVGVLTAMLCDMGSVKSFFKGRQTACSWVCNGIALCGGVTVWNIVWKMMREFYTNGGSAPPSGWQYGGHAAYFLFCVVVWLPVTLDAVVGKQKTWFTRFLSAPFFQIFGKLSFGLYLLHPIAIWMAFASNLEFWSFTRFNSLTVEIGGVAVVTSVFSFIMFFLVDRPVGKFVSFLGAVTGAKKKKKKMSKCKQT